MKDLEGVPVNERQKRMRKRDKYLVIVLTVLVLGVAAVAYFGYRWYGTFQYEIDNIRNLQQQSAETQVRTHQFLISSLDWSTKRQRLILYMRDKMVQEWRRCGFEADIGKAYDYAELVVRHSESYEIDPLLILAMQWKESTFIDTVKSPKGAHGLMQVMPATARPYFEIFGYSFSRGNLQRAPVNIRIGVKYFSDLVASYNDFGKSLAFYNGGVWNAYYYPDSLDRMHPETRAYVPAVLKKWDIYKEDFEAYRVDSSMVASSKKEKQRRRK